MFSETTASWFAAVVSAAAVADCPTADSGSVKTSQITIMRVEEATVRVVPKLKTAPVFVC